MHGTPLVDTKGVQRLVNITCRPRPEKLLQSQTAGPPRVAATIIQTSFIGLVKIKPASAL